MFRVWFFVLCLLLVDLKIVCKCMVSHFSFCLSLLLLHAHALHLFFFFFFVYALGKSATNCHVHFLFSILLLLRHFYVSFLRLRRVSFIFNTSLMDVSTSQKVTFSLQQNVSHTFQRAPLYICFIVFLAAVIYLMRILRQHVGVFIQISTSNFIIY